MKFKRKVDHPQFISGVIVTKNKGVILVKILGLVPTKH